MRFQFIFSFLIGFILFNIFKLNRAISDNKGKGVVFVGEKLPVRIARISKWLKENGYETVLLAQLVNPNFSNQSFNKIIRYNSKWELKAYLKQVPENFVVHYWGAPSRGVSIVPRSTTRPTILDTQDLYISYYGKEPPYLYMKHDLSHEEICLSESTGIIAQSFEASFALNEYGIEPRPKTLFFPFYCNDDIMVDYIPEKRKRESNELHFVYMGGISAKIMNNPKNKFIEFEDLISSLSKQNIHLHIYTNPYTSPLIKEVYEKIDQKNPLFHFHQTISQDQLIEEISTYDYGILPFYNEDGNFNATKRMYSISGKVINFIEACLPVLISPDLRFQEWISSRYGKSIRVEKNQWNSIREHLPTDNDYKTICKGIMTRRDTFRLSKNISRIPDFYDKCS